MNKKVVLVAVAVWPFPILNGLIVAYLSSNEENRLCGAIKLAASSSLLASLFYFILQSSIRQLTAIFFPNAWYFIITSVVGIATAVSMTILIKVKTKKVVLTEWGFEVRFFVRTFKEVEKELDALGFPCTLKSYAIVSEYSGGMEYECGSRRAYVIMFKELMFFEVIIWIKEK